MFVIILFTIYYSYKEIGFLNERRVHLCLNLFSNYLPGGFDVLSSQEIIVYLKMYRYDKNSSITIFTSITNLCRCDPEESLIQLFENCVPYSHTQDTRVLKVDLISIGVQSESPFNESEKAFIVEIVRLFELIACTQTSSVQFHS